MKKKKLEKKLSVIALRKNFEFRVGISTKKLYVVNVYTNHANGKLVQ